MHLTRRLPFSFAVLLLLAACSGGTAPSTDADDGAGSDATTAAATDAGGTPPTDGGSGSDDACVNTVEEVSAAFGVEITEAENTPNAGGGGALCTYFTDKAAFESAFVTTLTTGAAAQSVIDSYGADDSAEVVSGIGDEAIWYGEASTLFVRKGDMVLGLAAALSVSEALGDEAVRATLEDLGRSAADGL